MTRIATLTLVLDRDDQIRISVDGHELLRASTLAVAFRFIADRLEAIEPRAQLGALTTAIVRWKAA